MQENLLKMEGTVDEVIYRNEQNGYIILNLETALGIITIVGTLGNIVEGERLELSGSYVNNAKYGRQFKAEVCQRMLPTTPAEIRRYLGSGIIRGLGPAMAKKIVAAFGEESLDVIENDPLRLSQIKGLTSDKALYISSEYRKLCGVKTVVEFLQKYGISPMTSMAVWRTYDSSSISVIKDNPYVLCGSGIDVSFQTADEIAKELGIDTDDMNRVKAGVMYVLRENSFSGHTCLPRVKLAEIVCNELGVDGQVFDCSLEAGIKEGTFVSLSFGEREFVYITEFFNAEDYITTKLSQMLKLSAPLNKDFSDDIAGIEFTENIHYETLQKAAINGCLGNNLFILTGGPGTGKTTTLNAVIQLCKAKKKKLALAAPTGRAAKRMSDLTGEPARTIHRLLEVDFSKEDKLAFKHNETNQLKADVIVVDEMSMVDVLLFEALLRAVRLDAKLIMVGDSNQLPSVGAGNILRDLISGGHIPMVELKEIFRQAAESLIVTNAHKIVGGNMPELDNRKKDSFFMSCPDENDIPKLIIDLAKTRLPKTYGFDPIDDIQILTPTRIGVAGTKELNRELQLALNPPSRTKKELRFFDVVYRMGDKVMQIKNDYDVVWTKAGEKGSGVFNGDIGVVTDVDAHNGYITINFDGRAAIYTTEMLTKIEHAYAVTIHKSQGSEYSAVIMPLTSVSKNLLYRNLLYTGVTRAKKILILVGRKQLVYEMVYNNRKMLRYSCIKPLLESKLRKEGVVQ